MHFASPKIYFMVVLTAAVAAKSSATTKVVMGRKILLVEPIELNILILSVPKSLSGDRR